ncbi:MAG: peptidylprolyl isomerase, partial [Thermoplasmata archaeon]
SSEPDSASSQFYVCDGPQHGLDGDYAVFGVVVEGMDVVRKIASCETYGYKRPLLKDHPVDDIVMNIAIIPGHFENITKNETSKSSKSSSSIAGFEYVQACGALIVFSLFFAIWDRKKIR